MKVLVIGQGGREHALVWKWAQSASVDEVFCAPGNAGTGEDGTNVDISGTDAPRLVKFAKDNQIGLTVVGPEVPLMAGVADAFLDAKLPVFGPRAAAAELEGSKVFSKQLMQHANVPTADFQVFKHADAAQSYLQDREATSFVVKADGLAAGKGVIVCSSRHEALAAVETIMVERAFGDAGDRVIIEERLVGPEVSILAVVQGKTIIPLEAAQDHKPAYDGDLGPNTGGMGAYSPAALVTPELMDNIVSEVLVPTVHALKKDGREFCGILYAGLMICGDTPKVLEYNVRFGDPETQPVLMRLKSDLAEVLLAAAEGRLAEIPALEWDPRPAICVVMASDGYPGDYEKGRPIRGLEDAAALEDVKVFHASTVKQGKQVLTNGGRVLGVTAMGDTIAAAKLRAYQAVKCIRWDGAWCRKDISDKGRD